MAPDRAPLRQSDPDRGAGQAGPGALRLAPATLDRLPPAVERPAYDRAAMRGGIVHLGTGAFHRAHQADAVDRVLAAGDLDWGIVGSSLRSPDVRDALAPQGGLYTLAVRDGAGERLRVIGSIREVLVAPEDPAALLERLCRPEVRIVTITVTEKGYCHDPATGELREDHPDIRHDLAHPGSPRSVPGFLVEAVRRRRAAGLPLFTALSCDNLPANGRTLGRILRRFAELADPELGRVVAGELACPSAMVDRITPATTEEDRSGIAAALGLEDAAPVVTEPFSQWVVEDRFPAGRPDLAAVGVELVADVEPYELMKLRLLNGAHSMLAYLGYLAGFETIAETMKDPAFARLAEGVMREEAAPTLHMPAGTDLAGYIGELLARFRNPALKHRTWQICMDGSQKLPQRLLGTLRDRLAAGEPPRRVLLAVAGWMRYVTGRDEHGRPIDVRDPLAERLRRIADEAGPNAERLVPALLAVREVFGDDLARDDRVVRGLVNAVTDLFTIGAHRTVSAL